MPANTTERQRAQTNVGYVPPDKRWHGDMEQMKAYDSLPCDLRKALACAHLDYSAEQVLQEWVSFSSKHHGKVSELKLAEMLAEAYANTYEKERRRSTPLIIALAPYKNITD